jgi:hypothetical protein
MPDSVLTPSSPTPPSLIEDLTEDFYCWERRGRGWQLSPYPVELEPPYRPFFFRSFVAARARDDGKRPRAASTLARTLAGLFRDPAPAPTSEGVDDAFPEPEVEPFDASLFGDLTEIHVALPPGTKVTKEAAERLLLSLGITTAPIAFELVGLPEAIVVGFACREPDAGSLRRQLVAHFPEAVLEEAPSFLASRWRRDAPAFVVDFGLSEEFVRPLRALPSFAADPLTGLAGALSDLEAGELGVVQVLFQGVRHPWRESLLRSVLAPDGTPFFEDAPEMAALAREKVDKPLFAALLRVAVQSPGPERPREIARAVAASLAPLARPGSNALVPLTNEDYLTDEPYDDDLHIADVLARATHRSGMLLNAEELTALVHLPSESVRVEKLKRAAQRTHAAPEAAAPGLVLGENLHRGKTTHVVLPREDRLRHVHVLGATGTGKSTLLLNLILQDIRNGEGLGLIDPHGDLVNHVLDHIPAARHEDVVLFDAADADYPVGFNLLDARTEGERTLLESDLAALFRRFASSWGDQMHAVLTNAVAAFVRSTRGGTLADLRRFLLEAPYRRELLATVTDPAVTYYWTTEFPILKAKPEASIVTRLGTFLRSPMIRNILGQRETRLDFAAILNGRKILLAKLAQGEIGEENAYLLGSLLVSKLHQAAIARQRLPETERADWYCYIDEFQHFVTPSVAGILSGARKYGLGLILSHQDLSQLKERSTEVLASVLANAGTRIVFRVGAQDAKKLAESFASFDARDLQNLGRGEAIGRIGRSQDDFNLRVPPPTSIDDATARQNRERVITLSRARYARPRAEVEAELFKTFEATAAPPARRQAAPTGEPRREELQPAVRERAVAQQQAPEGPSLTTAAVARPSEPIPRLTPPTPGRGGAEHKYCQEQVRRFGEARGFRVTIEKAVLDGAGSIDVALEKDALSIAVEISVTSTADYELQNLHKCLAAGFTYVVLLSSNVRTLEKLRRRATAEFSADSLERIRVLSLQEFIEFLGEADPGPEARTVRGYKVKLDRTVVSAKEAEFRKRAIAEVLLKSSQKMRDKE